MGCWESDGEDDDVEDDAEDAPVADDALAEGDGASVLQKWRNLQIAKNGPWEFALLWVSSGTLDRCSNTDVAVVTD